jgi:hypothetical protein
LEIKLTIKKFRAYNGVIPKKDQPKMVSLQDTCCLDISFDPASNKLVYGQQVAPGATRKILLRNLIPALLNKSLHYPEVVYEEHVQVFNDGDQDLAESGLSFDLLFIPAGLLGVEFIKSHIYYTPGSKDDPKKFSTVIEVHLGILTVIMQKNNPKDEFDVHTSVAEGLIVKLKRGEKLAIPQGYFYNFINTEEEPVVFVRIHKADDIVDYTLLRRERGLAYYCIRKNARQEIVLNPVYRSVPHIRTLKANSYVSDAGLDPLVSLYTQLRKTTDLFLEMLWG